MSTVVELIRSRANDDRVGLRWEDRSWTFREYVRECETRAQLLHLG